MTDYKTTNRFSALLVLLFLMTCLMPCQAQSWGDDSAQWAWVKETWTGNDKPYLAIQKSIDRQIKNGQKPDALLKQYGNTFVNLGLTKNRKDPQALFAWAYSALRASMLPNPSIKGGADLVDITNAYDRVVSPLSYHYDRIRFLTVRQVRSDDRMLIIAQRLAARDPKDLEVKQAMAREIIGTNFLKGKGEGKMKAIRLLNEVIKAQPKNATAYSNLGTLYFLTSICRPHDPIKIRRIEARKAIINYKKYLALTPKGVNPFRVRVVTGDIVRLEELINSSP